MCVCLHACMGTVCVCVVSKEVRRGVIPGTGAVDG